MKKPFAPASISGNPVTTKQHNKRFVSARAIGARTLILLVSFTLASTSVQAQFLKNLLNNTVNQVIDHTSQTAKDKVAGTPPATQNQSAQATATVDKTVAEPADATTEAIIQPVLSKSAGTSSSLEYSDGQYLKARVISARRTNGTLDLLMEYTNLSNNDCRIQIDAQGANTTAVVDNQGGQWKYLTATHGGTKGTKDMLFQQGIPTRVPLRFSLTTGNTGAASFNLVNTLAITFPDKSGSRQMLKVDIRKIPAGL